jgi:ribosome-associated protein YbcJ (S4-like RNA binding protein)
VRVCVGVIDGGGQVKAFLRHAIPLKIKNRFENRFRH